MPSMLGIKMLSACFSGNFQERIIDIPVCWLTVTTDKSAITPVKDKHHRFSINYGDFFLDDVREFNYHLVSEPRFFLIAC